MKKLNVLLVILLLSFSFLIFGENTSAQTCVVEPLFLDFDTVSVGVFLEKTFTISNTGSGVLEGTVSEDCDYYSIVGDTDYSLTEGQSKQFTVRFAPTDTGSFNCTIETGNILCGDVSCIGSGFARYWHLHWDDPNGIVYKGADSIPPWDQMGISDSVYPCSYVKIEKGYAVLDQIIYIGVKHVHLYITVEHEEPCQIYHVETSTLRPIKTEECPSLLRCLVSARGEVESDTKKGIYVSTQTDSVLLKLESPTAVAYTYLKNPGDLVEFEMWFIKGSPSGYCSKTRFRNTSSSTKAISHYSLIGSDTTTASPGYTTFFYSDGESKTEVALAAFDVMVDNKAITLNWQTGNEIDNLGFNVYRSKTQDGEFSRINTDMISAKGSAFAGASYSFTDENVTSGATYYYKLEDIDVDGFNTFHGPIMAKAVAAPTQFALGQNYPNPFNASTQISYSLKSDADVTLKIYNILGQEVKTLVNKHQTAGNYTITWNGKDSRGNDIATGIYFYRIKAGDFSFERKMAYLK
ncbi:MAG: hypothetical protein AMJ90_06510 [candidate division Zixibacteria bacterium SM23_73_2]|nr:MAG: hypothetical protein AMJ90_06510 [candidate division Zixibacteria bacterium SM23_73_2]